MEAILNNDNKKISRSRKRRIDRRLKMNNDMKLLLNKIEIEKKER